ncbi:MAG: hypothetical protein QXZ31_07175 [Thermofilaceae archaeon]
MIIDVLLAGLAVYVASSFALIIYTAMTRPMDFVTFLATVREVAVLAVETMWWLLLLMAWGVLPRPQAMTISAEVPPPNTFENALVNAGILFLALLAGLVWISGKVWTAFLIVVLSVVLFLPYAPLDLLTTLLAIGFAAAAVAYLLYLQQREEVKGGRRRYKPRPRQAEIRI